jgi:hypothetical protein
MSVLRPGDAVVVIDSYEGGRTIERYTGMIFAIWPSGTVIVIDDKQTDGRGMPVRHYVTRGVISKREPAIVIVDDGETPDGSGYGAPTLDEAITLARSLGYYEVETA